MIRLSLKPCEEPAVWEFIFPAGYGGPPSDDGYTHLFVNAIPDSDLIDIRSTLSEYLDAKYEAVQRDNEQPLWVRRPMLAIAGVTVGFLFLCAAALGMFWFLCHPPEGVAVSTGGVIDQLCMRPDIECSTSIRYVHPQAGVPHQERETYSADSLSQAHLEEQ